MAKIMLAAATLPQLIAFATVSIGLEVPDSPKPTKESVRALISSAFAGDEIEVDDEAIRPEGGVKLTLEDIRGRKRVRINIGIQENVAGGSDAVPVGCNGTVALIMRGQDVDVPVEYVEVLRNAQKMIYDRGPNSELINPRLTPIYPFSTYRAAPMIAKTIAARPWKLVKYMTIAYALNALAYAWDDEGDEEKERASLRDEEQGKTWLGVPRMMRMPFRNDDGLPVFLDVRRWMPAGDIFDTNQGSSAIPIPSPLQFGGPLLMGFEIALNKQGFTGEEITNREIDTTTEQLGKVGDYLWKGWLPSAAWIPGSWYWDKLKNAANGATDGQGRPYDLPSAISSSIGIKLKPQDVESGLGWQYRDFQKVETELKAEAKRLARQRERGLISQAAFDAGMATFLEKLGRVGKEAEELQRASSR